MTGRAVLLVGNANDVGIAVAGGALAKHGDQLVVSGVMRVKRFPEMALETWHWCAVNSLLDDGRKHRVNMAGGTVNPAVVMFRGSIGHMAVGAHGFGGMQNGFVMASPMQGKDAIMAVTAGYRLPGRDEGLDI